MNRLFFCLLLIIPFNLPAQELPESEVASLAEQYFSTKNFNLALDLFAGLADRHPDVDYYFERFWVCHYEMGNYEMAWEALRQRYLSTGQPDWLEDLGRMSVLLGKPDRAWSEWTEYLKAYDYNPDVVRSVGSVMISLRRYDLARRLFMGQRGNDGEFAYSHELFNIAVQSFQPADAAAEALKLLAIRPEMDSSIESRMAAVFEDSSSVSVILKTWDSAPVPLRTPSWWRLKGSWHRLAGQFDEAYRCVAQTDKLMKNNGQYSYSLINQLRNAEDSDGIIRLTEQFLKDFPTGNFRQQAELKLGQALVNRQPVTGQTVIALEEIYKRQKTGDTNRFLDLWLNGILRSTGDPMVKAGKIDSILALNKTKDRFYWEWTTAVLRTNWNGAMKVFDHAAFKNQYRWEFILTAFSGGVQPDSLRGLLFSWARDLKSPDNQRYLYLLVQSVPVPAMDFSDFSTQAKGLLMLLVEQPDRARQFFVEVKSMTTDPVIKDLAWREIWKIDIGRKDFIALKSHVTESESLSKPGPDLLEPLYKTGELYFKSGQLNESARILTWMVSQLPESPWSPLARALLGEIRKVQMSS